MSANFCTLAYFTHTFPGYTSTFIVDEILAMRSLGAKIDIFAVHIPPRDQTPPDFRQYAQETKSIFPLSPLSLFLEHLRAAFTRPSRYFRSARIALLGGERLSLKNRLRTFVHWAQAPVLYRLFRQAAIQHVHVHFLHAPTSIMYFVNQIYGLPFTVTAHGSDIFVEKVLQKEKLLAARFTRVMTKYNLETLSELFVSDNGPGPALVHIPLGLQMTRFLGNAPKPPQFTFLSVGRMVWQKGHRLLLEACRILKSNGQHFRLVLVGDGELRHDIAKWIRELGLGDTVITLGALPKHEILHLYRTTHCFVLSSLSEGSPAVLIEAMSEGQPVIAPELNGIPEMFCHGKEGWFFTTGSAQGLASTMDCAIRSANVLGQMGALARANAEKQFDLGRNTQVFYSKMLEVLPKDIKSI